MEAQKLPIVADSVAVPVRKKQISVKSLGIGALVNVFQVTTLGQPFEVLKTHVSSHRSDSLLTAARKTWARGGMFGFYQGLIPWAWLEASTKGSVLILTTTHVERISQDVFHLSRGLTGFLSGIAGGAAQSYLTMGMTTCMKTVEVTRSKATINGVEPPGTMATFFNILRTKGIRGVNRGVNAVALRQITGWSSRMGISRVVESLMHKYKSSQDGGRSGQKLSVAEKIFASTVGGTLSCWNQPFEVLRVEMQSLKADPTRPEKLTMASAAKHIYKNDGVMGFYRGVVPRIAVASWATICMVGFGDILKERFLK